MNTKNTQHIALISVHGDPAIEIGKEEAGGQNVYVRQVGEALAKQGWQVDMFTRLSSSNQATIVEHTPGCRTIRLTAGPKAFVPRQEIFEYCGEFLSQLLEFQEQSGIDYSIVHTNYWLSAWVGMEWKKRQSLLDAIASGGNQRQSLMGGTPKTALPPQDRAASLIQVHTYHSLGAVKYESVETIPKIAATRLEIEKAVLETSERIVATSPQEEEHMRTLVSSKGDIDIIPCGTDIDRFGKINRLEARQKLGQSPENKIIFYLGRFDERKGIETLVRAVGCSQLRGDANLKLIIGGGSRPGEKDGMERDRIEGIVAELELQTITTFPGRIADELLPAYYAAADVCIVPSHYEPFGLVAIEAMASGTPVVASDVGGLQFTVVSEETGLLAPPKDASAFAAAIDRILSDHDWKNQLGLGARARVEHMFSWNGVAHQLSQLYKSLLEAKSENLATTSA
ncbi:MULTISPECIES: glycosyltransferase [Moorena]|uniref:Glycosyltransferase n=1 Tax=Moorena producens 3L TaxID=489825 RepID=F4XQW3_9CYAN|nr:MULTISPECIES: glycosyltransferase [Moorena]NEQ12469.1 glycosyltransferase family 1 protein [Moorena sp. SIO3E2]EGJ32938.1 glycosyltransferase [Moorena producens 3L]NEP30693.1 glycosyltransferase family 1 protein [Moorena sp. SIO3B2]NEP64068.1 glycosyltransferase family 1 protein [Moorena sp. SIO3A5]NEQ05069.1 glycosyltransferase family 1 protein [Moorena sp. SIO4E2]